MIPALRSETRWLARAPLAAALAVILVAPVLVPEVALAAGGSSAPAPSTSIPPQQQSPAEMADEHYNRGLKLRDRAWKLEEKAASATGAELEKLETKIGKAYRNAAEEQSEAVKLEPRHHRAYSSLGYALRKLGDYEASLTAYDRALALAPSYAEAVEYRAEAYLHLGRLDEAKEAYMLLFSRDRDRADELMKAMKEWVDENGDSPQGAEFGAWVAQRAQLADQTASLTTEAQRAW